MPPTQTELAVPTWIWGRFKTYFAHGSALMPTWMQGTLLEPQVQGLLALPPPDALKTSSAHLIELGWHLLTLRSIRTEDAESPLRLQSNKQFSLVNDFAL